MNISDALDFNGLKRFYTNYIKPLKTGAFATVVNNGTTTVANTVLDGRMGKTLADKDANLQNQIDTLNSALNNLKPILLWEGEQRTGAIISLNQMVDNFTRLTFVYKRSDGFYYNASFLVSTLLKTKPDTGVQQIFNTGTDTTIYINPDNHYFAGIWMTNNLQIIEVYGHRY